MRSWNRTWLRGFQEQLHHVLLLLCLNTLIDFHKLRVFFYMNAPSRAEKPFRNSCTVLPWLFLIAFPSVSLCQNTKYRKLDRAQSARWISLNMSRSLSSIVLRFAYFHFLGGDEACPGDWFSLFESWSSPRLRVEDVVASLIGVDICKLNWGNDALAVRLGRNKARRRQRLVESRGRTSQIRSCV